MREIKFRAWNPDSKKMTYVANDNGSYLHLGGNHGFINPLKWYVSDGNSSVAYSDRSILMQFTGLKDKNGKEIYEGDIIRSEHWNPMVYQVAFDRGAFYIALPDKHEAGDIKYAEHFEIIGNIYENPELLK